MELDDEHSTDAANEYRRTLYKEYFSLILVDKVLL